MERYDHDGQKQTKIVEARWPSSAGLELRMERSRTGHRYTVCVGLIPFYFDMSPTTFTSGTGTMNFPPADR